MLRWRFLPRLERRFANVGKRRVHGYGVFATHDDASLALSFDGGLFTGDGTRGRMAPSSVDATITVDGAPGFALEERSRDALPEHATLPPFSVSVYRFEANPG